MIETKSKQRLRETEEEGEQADHISWDPGSFCLSALPFSQAWLVLLGFPTRLRKIQHHGKQFPDVENMHLCLVSLFKGKIKDISRTA